ncbi:hypothetical protein ANN_08633 [Periplaneta americana]|uniref:Uncharacterized protein n=1 Tax=Periplaneta americana TaxID=6978 RepID=A0ABQ8T3L9_PERAM|nr:hypothetical protein ANN_08633 [Periplaneta americana]
MASDDNSVMRYQVVQRCWPFLSLHNNECRNVFGIAARSYVASNFSVEQHYTASVHADWCTLTPHPSHFAIDVRDWLCDPFPGR